MANPISQITIVGGGTSGWLSALFLARNFAREVAAGSMMVNLIESPRIPIIGVGESLSPSMPETLKSLGISERELFRETDATFKLAGYFRDWERPAAKGGSTWVNPFVGYLSAGYEYERFDLGNDIDGSHLSYDATISPCRDAIERNLAPRGIGQPEYSALLRYAYHLDAAKFAQLLKRHAMAAGVTHIVAEVSDVDLNDRGFIRALRLDGREPLPVDLVIDASGFSSVILHRALGVDLVDYGHHLLNDRAVVAQIATEPEAPLEPATRATAIRQGWCFQVPLVGRTGNGYIFSSQFTDDDRAATDFARHLGLEAPDGRFRVIPMRVGRARNTWVRNCVAIGLAAGFVEPLEASAIYSVETSLKWLFNYFPDKDFEPALAQRYNVRTAQLYDEVVEYIVLHYRLSGRNDDPYWLTQKNETKLPERLAENLKVWRYALPVQADVLPTNYFDHNTYTAALFGKGFYPGGSLRPERLLDRDEWLDTKAMIARTHGEALAKLPPHRALVESLRV